MKLGFVIPVMLLASPLAAQDGPIQDNSFLLEEAYNQERGVVQHISVFTHDLRGRPWAYAFTQEWPMGSQRHQLSYTVPVEQTGTTGIGDVALNYRYQLVGSGATRVAIAPRFSLLLPTGDEANGRGTGGVGVQAGFPVSWVIAPKLVAHTNVGYTYTPSAKDGAGNRARISTFSAGQSLIALLSPRLNLMVEAVWANEEFVTGPGTRGSVTSSFISPGLRYAINLRSGMQIVPGFAVPIGIGDASGERSLLLYLSFEHPFKR